MPKPPVTLLDPVTVSVSTGLVSPGDTISASGHLDVVQAELGGRTFAFDDGLDYDLALTNTGEGILATGIVRGLIHAACDRCLEPTDINLASEVTCYYLREVPEDEDADESDYDFGVIDADTMSIDLSEAIRGAVSAEIPFVILCQEDCKGLCATCGCNLNVEQCSCAEDAPIDPMNPFAALANLKFDEGTE